ncbi:UDP-2,4-diacetamido-2,4,6-trideoxy-beta-L-altropyranose hydrolase [Jannaschia faecimaris]|uniref:UDP-2,4-diacetamido-2,4,6-trideoxy-beta-L-altropyranose hydrolase n=1 Tax=Jannaschia faecimaris TaxID=1244108 RepID=A0A1H3JQY4_9RHOB|nr:UDP-2,4-diacetamido-2,4,6-trideoxy-beta-L-altropyranose hydrolase [Jannaschia faecimaris]SDY42301.1 UDP-2,4-diacetamido-2,4,6-trideoxy-beta-L-altropyranose hydrolase [Jannaschia faecimaris]
MRVLIRVDGDRRIGGGHVMRCLTLADALTNTGHRVEFVMADASDGMADRVRSAGFEVHSLPVSTVASANAPPHAAWRRVDPEVDGMTTGKIAARTGADWLIWDHYGLDADWVAQVRGKAPDIRVLAIDDLDDRELASDLLLDQTRLAGELKFGAAAVLRGPGYALLRPEFATLRDIALTRRGGPVRRVLVTPGMMDAAGLAPLVLDALKDFDDLEVEVVMSADAQSAEAVRDHQRPGVTLTLDAIDMGERMVAADLCVGAGGMTSWERCCLGLPTVTVTVADNQRDAVAGLAEAGAIVPLSLEAARDPPTLRHAIQEGIDRAGDMSRKAAKLCDGRGAGRVVCALEARLRPLTLNDAEMMMSWRNQPRIVAVTSSQAPVTAEGHIPWLTQELTRDDARWCVWQEGGRDVGICGASGGPDGWTWSFYLGDEDAPQGAGGRMCGAFLRLLAETPGAETIRATVRHENTTSLRLHRRLGFAEVPSDDPSVLAFALKTWEVRQRLRLPQRGPDT